MAKRKNSTALNGADGCASCMACGVTMFIVALSGILTPIGVWMLM